MPDYFQGDPFPVDALEPGKNFDLPAWLKNHTEDHTRQGVGSTQGRKARYIFDLAFENIIKVAAVSHPSLLKVPEDIKKYFSTSKAPLLINSCTVDQQSPLESSALTDEILGGGKFAPGYKREYFEGCTHGFAVRGDMTDFKVKAGKEGAFKSIVEWFSNKL